MINPNRPFQKHTGLMVICEIMVTITLLVGGALVGEKLTQYVVPGHEMLQLVGLMMLPLALVIGLHCWLGLAFAREIWRGAKGSSTSAFTWHRPSGVAILLPFSLVVCAIVGGVASTFSPFSAAYVVYLYLTVGAVYGGLAWILGHYGYFDFWKWIGGDHHREDKEF